MLDMRTNVDLQDYFADLLTPGESLNNTVAKELLKSAKHGWAAHPRLGGKAPTIDPKKATRAMKLGQILDEVVTSKERRLQLMPFDDYRSKAAQAARDEAIANGMIPVKQAELDKARERAESVTKNLGYHGISLEGFENQVCILWDEQASNGARVQCRCLLDFLQFSEREILIRDLKSTNDCSPGEGLHRKMAALKYHMQAACYISAVTAVWPEMAGRVRFENVLVEDEWPYEPLLTEFDGPALTHGRVLWQRAVDRWELCMRTGRWPGYMVSGVSYRVELPNYLIGELYEDQPEDESDDSEQAEAY